MSASSTSETFYLYRDTDTYAFELPEKKADPKALRFGWQFRPVLGQKAVESGIRQLFAVIALDETDGAAIRNCNPETIVPLEVNAKSHWLEITEFKAALRGDHATTFKTLEMAADEAFLLEQAAPCPTVCIVTPSGAIRCFPRC